MGEVFRRSSENITEIRSRSIPKIGGSVAGFVILIVALCLIILISLIAIYYLLREDSTSDDELQKPYKRPRTATYVTPLDGGPRPSSWLRRTYQRFKLSQTGSSDRIPQIKIGENQSQRSFLPSPQNEWHAESVDDFRLKAPPPKQPSRYSHSQIEKLNTATLTGSGSKRLSTATSTGSVRFDLNNARDPLPLERDRFAPSPTATLPSIYTRMSSPPSSPGTPPSFLPKRSRSIPHEGSLPSLASPSNTRYEQDTTQDSPVTSSPALTTFEGGTKFLETF